MPREKGSEHGEAKGDAAWGNFASKGRRV